MKTLKQIREKLQPQQQQNQNGYQSDNSLYPFWNISDNSSCTIRFLPDADDNNDFFWVERQTVKLTFSPETPDGKEVIVQVPCVEQWGEKCPILSTIRPWFKESTEKADLARKYWKKRTYLYQGFVVNSGLVEEHQPENPIRRFVLSKSLHEKVTSFLLSDDLDEMPTDYTHGRDFKITKTKRGQYADYSTSSFSMRTRKLSEVEQNAITEFGLFDLKTFLPKRPTPRDMEVINAMFHASLNQEPYNPVWEGVFRASSL